MSEQDNGNGKPQPGQVPLQAEITPQGVRLSCAYPVQFGLPKEMMDQLAEEWIMSNPPLLLKVVQRAKAAQKQELALIKHIAGSKNN